jgi:hypothetical protein
MECYRQAQGERLYVCKLCRMEMPDRPSLIEHLKEDHEPIEILSYAAITMTDEQDRDASALEFNRRFQGLKKIIGE